MPSYQAVDLGPPSGLSTVGNVMEGILDKSIAEFLITNDSAEILVWTQGLTFLVRLGSLIIISVLLPSNLPFVGTIPLSE